MKQLWKSVLGLAASSVVSCGAPAELDESLFPAPGATGYDRQGGPIGANGGAAGVVPGNGGNGSGTANGGNLNVSQGGSVPLGMGGSADPGGGGGGGASVSQGGDGGGAPIGGAGGGEPPGMGGSEGGGDCPDDITVLFNRPGTEGGCAGSGCHIAGNTPPDLVSPNVETRLLDVLSRPECGSVPYISAGSSLLADKITGSPPSCGAAMPFLAPQALNAADEQCILDWIAEVSGG